MKSFNPIKDEQEFKALCKAHAHDFIRLIEYRMDELDSGWRTLSRRERDILRHKIEFLEDLAHDIESGAAGSITAKRFNA